MFAKKPEPEPERALSAVEEIFAYRYIRLLALGLDPDEAVALIDIPDVAAEAERLYANGCPPNLILKLLKGD